MSYAIIDAREWQNTLDLRTGKKVSSDCRQTDIVRAVLKRHPYPGDVSIESNCWVTDTALDLVELYNPALACLMYSHQFFAGRFTPMTPGRRQEMIESVFAEVDRFVRRSGYEPVIIGSGDMVELAGNIDLSKLDGISISSHWSGRYAGLHAPAMRDLDVVRSSPHIERVVPRNEWIDLFGGTEYDRDRIPDYLLVAREGWTFLATGAPLRKAVRIPGAAWNIPVSTALGRPESILDIRSLIERNLPATKIALIIIEGIGAKDFPLSHTLCGNSVGWYYYEPGDAQYLSITTGRHQVFAYPSGYQYHDEIDARRDYPFSGYFLEIPKHTIGRDFAGRSIAVGNHSMFVHMVFGADLCIECFARNLYNQGCLGVIHREDCNGLILTPS